MKLIVIRGNSGSGKSSIAAELHKQAKSKTALVSQDYLRRIVLKEKEHDGGDYIDLIFQTIKFASGRGYNVILEGILNSRRHEKLISAVSELYSERYFYYIDVSFDETLRRHKTKLNAHEFGEKEMREWFKESDLLGIDGEQTIPEGSTLKKSVDKIISETDL